MTEEIAVVCRHCGAIAVKNLGWVQAHRDFRCERCGGVSKLDKDRLSLILAGRKPGPGRAEQSPASNVSTPTTKGRAVDGIHHDD